MTPARDPPSRLAPRPGCRFARAPDRRQDRFASVTLAPELPGADVLIDLLQLRGITVSCGHTDARPRRQAEAAFDRGSERSRTSSTRWATASPRSRSRSGPRLARKDVVVQIIVDGIHLADETAKVVWRAAGRVALVTDAIARTGAVEADGDFSLGSLEVSVRDGVARGPDGVLAGSLLTMIEAVRNLHALGVPLETR